MKNRLLAVMVGLVVIVLIAHDVPLSAHLAQIERDRLITAIQRDAFIIGGRVTPLMGLVDEIRTREISAVLNDYSRRSDGIVVVVDDKGYLAARSGQMSSVGEDYVRRPEIVTALLGTPTSGTRLSTTLGGELVYVAVPMLSGTEVLGVVRITYPKSVVDARVNQNLRGILFTAAISVAMAVMVALLFARFVTRSLDDLRRTTEKFADGDLDANAQEFGPPETRKLASSFNLMAKRLGRMIDQQRSFAGDASHQLRTPLTALRLRLEQANDLVNSDPSGARHHLEEALSESDRLSYLVEQLLQLARAEGLTLPLEDLKITELVTERVEQWSSLAEEHGVSLVADISTNVHGRGNAMALGEILDNYIDNALEISPTGSTVRVTDQVGNDILEIIVRDEGPGLSDEQRLRAFDRFWRGDEQSNRRSGSGLGLAIVSQLANASGYHVELRKSPHGGIDAVVRVPRASVQDI
ncbi:MAG: sensor histidine kinase [Ilumatobacteraceae bacterium]